MDVFSHLSRSRGSVANITDPSAKGVYAIFSKTENCLPCINLPRNSLVYIGKSFDLERRNHFKAKNSGIHSPRRSLGAILRMQLGLNIIPRGSGASETDYHNFRFTEEGEEHLTCWMHSNLEYANYPYDGDVDQLEKRLISENKPPLNLKGWPNPQREIIEAKRKKCKEKAKAFARRRN
jgi:hypothetical protein